jgi:hypothetical protein
MSKPNRAETRLYVRALKQGWNIPRGMRSQIVERLHGIITAADSKSRERTAAARALLQASRVELDAIRLAYGADYENLSKRIAAMEGKNDGGLATAACEN